MSIIIKKISLIIFFTSFLFAKEPFLATLVSIDSNDIQTFQYGTIKFTCLPYGVVALDQLYREADEKSNCKKSIRKYYQKRRDLLFYTNTKMHREQIYSIKRKENNRCIVHVAGEKSLSEFLLDKGLAVVKPAFQDRLYRYYFKSAEKKARLERIGLWNENIKNECVAYLYVKDNVE